MSKKLLLGIIIVLLITNITTLLFWNKNEEPEVVIDDDETDNGSKIDVKEPVASIDGKDITYEEWISKLRKNHGQKQLKNMVDKAVVKQLAEEKDMEVSEKVIDREIALLTMTQGVMTKEEREKKEAQWREDIIFRYQLESLLTADTPIPEEEIRSFYDGYHKQYDFQAATQLSHIVVSDTETAEKVEKELDDGASFPLLAKEYSIDDETRDNGGYLGFFVDTSQFIPDGYIEKTTEMEEHSYSKPFATGNGVAIIYLHSKLPSITFTYDEIKPYVKGELALDESNQSLSVDPLWDKLDIEWVYEE